MVRLLFSYGWEPGVLSPVHHQLFISMVPMVDFLHKIQMQHIYQKYIFKPVLVLVDLSSCLLLTCFTTTPTVRLQAPVSTLNVTTAVDNRDTTATCKYFSFCLWQVIHLKTIVHYFRCWNTGTHIQAVSLHTLEAEIFVLQTNFYLDCRWTF